MKKHFPWWEIKGDESDLSSVFKKLNCDTCKGSCWGPLSTEPRQNKFVTGGTRSWIQFKALPIQTQFIHQNISSCTLKCETLFQTRKSHCTDKWYLLSSWGQSEQVAARPNKETHLYSRHSPQRVNPWAVSACWLSQHAFLNQTLIY